MLSKDVDPILLCFGKDLPADGSVFENRIIKAVKELTKKFDSVGFGAIINTCRGTQSAYRLLITAYDNDRFQNYKPIGFSRYIMSIEEPSLITDYWLLITESTS